MRLRELLRSSGGAVIAFSGGVDSTFLLKVAREELGERALAVTATSETYPSRELKEAKELARAIGARHLVIESEELEIPGFRENPPERCYFCKGELFSKLKEIAQREGLPAVFDGTNFDDLSDHRPGRAAAEELGVRSPLQEVGLAKEEIRALSRRLGLPTWDKPAFACLSSRFPYGSAITREKLRAIDEAEEYLRALGFGQLRVRHHGDIARVELTPEEMERVFREGLTPRVTEKLKSLGFTYVTLDLEGYRTGSMNEPLKGERA
ncbi:MAG: ATP-dependent sacrificial sulfur transferase LarE [Nitrospinota bacterium]